MTHVYCMIVIRYDYLIYFYTHQQLRSQHCFIRPYANLDQKGNRHLFQPVRCVTSVYHQHQPSLLSLSCF